MTGVQSTIMDPGGLMTKVRVERVEEQLQPTQEELLSRNKAPCARVEIEEQACRSAHEDSEATKTSN